MPCRCDCYSHFCLGSAPAQRSVAIAASTSCFSDIALFIASPVVATLLESSTRSQFVIQSHSERGFASFLAFRLAIKVICSLISNGIVEGEESLDY